MRQCIEQRAHQRPPLSARNLRHASEARPPEGLTTWMLNFFTRVGALVAKLRHTWRDLTRIGHFSR